jgi:hypothetical protein
MLAANVKLLITDYLTLIADVYLPWKFATEEIIRRLEQII